MDSPSGNRLTAITADNHQPWLWFTHVFSIALLVYIGYSTVMLFALINGLGKANDLISKSQEIKASMLVFTSRMILCVILSLVQFSTISLIQEVLTKDATKWWFRVIVGMIIAKAILAALIISVNCSPAGTLAGKDNINCSNNTVRWVSVTTVEAILEILLTIPVVMIVSNLQTNLKNKLWVINPFVCRSVVWVPSWMHLAFYIQFMRIGRPNIDMVPIMVTEELWAALALVSASIPVVMRISKQFTTFGIALGAPVKERTGRSFRLAPYESSPSLPKDVMPSFVAGTIISDAPLANTANKDGSIHSTTGSHVAMLGSENPEKWSD